MTLKTQYPDFTFLPYRQATNGKVYIVYSNGTGRFIVFNSPDRKPGTVVCRDGKIRGFMTIEKAIEFARKLK